MTYNLSLNIASNISLLVMAWPRLSISLLHTSLSSCTFPWNATTPLQTKASVLFSHYFVCHLKTSQTSFPIIALLLSCLVAPATYCPALHLPPSFSFIIPAICVQQDRTPPLFNQQKHVLFYGNDQSAAAVIGWTIAARQHRWMTVIYTLPMSMSYLYWYW